MRIDIRPTPHDQLNGLRAVGGPLVIKLTWNVPNVETYAAAQIYVNTINDFESATMHTIVTGNNFDYPTKDALRRYFWIRAVDKWGHSTGAITGPGSAAGSLINSESIGIFDLATTNIIGTLSNSKISGLGALATLSKVDVTQVTNLGALATVNQLAANQIGAGQLAAGVIYAGSINAANVTAGVLTGQTYRTATSGKRVEINGTAYSNAMAIYDASGVRIASLGGGTGSLYAQGSGSEAAVYAIGSLNSNSSGVFASSEYGAAIQTRSYGSSIGLNVIAADNGPGISIEGGNNSDAMRITRGNSAIVQTGGGASYLRTVNPATDAGYSLGTSVTRWSTAYLSSAPIVSSDVRLKTDITDSDLGLAFINDLRPIKYKQVVAAVDEQDNFVLVEPEVVEEDDEGNKRVISVAKYNNDKVVSQREGIRDHYGLPAQEVQATLIKHGVPNSAIWTLADASDPNSSQALRYEELISPMIKAIQELSAEVARLRELVQS